MKPLEFLDVVWADKEGWVDVPSKSGGHWMPWIAEWPADRVLVGDRIARCLEDSEDVYFSVAVFGGRGRRLSDVLPTSWLWADLDRIDPVFLDEEEVLPTVAWESSPGRYQCLWRLEKELKPEKQTILNRRLTHALGADAGGYDLTQVLRPVGTENFKYGMTEAGEGLPVELLWYHPERIYVVRDVIDAVREMEAEDGQQRRRARGAQARAVDLSAYRLSARARRLLRTPEDRVVEGERSDRLWELECLLAEAGLDADQIHQLVVDTPWNKWKEVASGDDQLRRDIARALAKVAKSAKARKAAREGREASARGDEADGGGESRTRGVRVSSPFVDYATFISTNIETPRWLIEQIWGAESHGIMGGEPKTGKTLASLAMGLSVATGKPFLGVEEFSVPEPGPALMVQDENAPWAMQDRLRKLAWKYGLMPKEDVEITAAPEGAIVQHIVRLNFPTEAPLKLLNNYGFDMTDEEDRVMLEAEIKKEGAKLVILDPLYLMTPGIDLNRQHEISPILQWLMSLHYNYNCAVMVIHHWAKVNENSSQRRSGQRLMGTGIFHGWIDSALYVEHIEKGNNLLKVRMERELRNSPPTEDLEVIWRPGTPGELDLDVSVRQWNLEGVVASTIEELLPKCDDRGLNLKLVASELGWGNNTESRLQAAKIARATGFKVKKKRYPNGNAYIIYPGDAYVEA